MFNIRGKTKKSKFKKRLFGIKCLLSADVLNKLIEFISNPHNPNKKVLQIGNPSFKIPIAICAPEFRIVWILKDNKVHICHMLYNKVGSGRAFGRPITEYLQ